MDPIETSRKRWLMVTAITALTLLAYWPAMRGRFIWDDTLLIHENAIMHAPDGLYRIWFTTEPYDFMPLTYSTWWFEWHIWGEDTFGYHLFNVMLHAGTAVLLWRVLVALGVPGALLAGFVFALHPVHAESVAWISERKNTLSMFFAAGSTLLYLRSEGNRRFYITSIVCFLLATLAKAAVAPLPVVLIVIDAWRKRREVFDRRVYLRVVPYFAIAAVTSLLTIYFQHYNAIGEDIVRSDSFFARLAGAGWAIWFYLYKLILPVNLNFNYPRWDIDTRSILSYVPLAVLIGIYLVVYRIKKPWARAVEVAMICYVVMLLPVIGFFDIYFMKYSLVTDHWHYPATIAMIALAAAVFASRVKKPNTRAGVGALVGAILFSLTWHRAEVFAGPVPFWQDILIKNPASWLAHSNYGVILMSQHRFEEAEHEMREVLKYNPEFAEAHLNLGLIALEYRRDVATAIKECQNALAINPKYGDAHYNLGRVYLVNRQYKDAVDAFRQAASLKPTAEAYDNLGFALFRWGKREEAITAFKAALKINPNLGLARKHLEDASAL